MYNGVIMDKSIGVYIHIPFCKSKCYYCDFNSYSGMEHLAGSYFNALFSEIRNRAKDIEGRPVRSIFIGGGTPSLADPGYITELLEICAKHMQIRSDAEISMESNPGTLTYDRLKSYRAAGINRLSIGLQAWQDRLLKELGRIHNRQQYIDNLDAAYRAGFRNINTDLIFGLPGQTIDDWTETLESVMQLNVSHISCYDLKIEEGTVFGDRLDAGLLIPADDELDRQMYHYAIETLAMKGFRHYEISNFAREGYECRHNLIYWKALEYAGFGAGAHSYLNGMRFSNVKGAGEYIDGVDKTYAHRSQRPIPHGELQFIDHGETQFIDDHAAMSEFMILGLRLTDGIYEMEFEERFGRTLKSVYGGELEKLLGKGLLIYNEKEGCIRLSDIGLDFANQVFMEFI